MPTYDARQPQDWRWELGGRYDAWFADRYIRGDDGRGTYGDSIGFTRKREGARAVAEMNHAFRLGREYERVQAREALNNAVDAIVEAITGSDRDTDLLNLVVNVALSYLDGTAETVADAIQANYSETPETVLGWFD
jgi:hypothetical protein